MAIEIKCTGSDTLPLDAIEEFQGNLKKRTKKDIEKIITSIKKYGFSFPFFIWNGAGHNYCLDGHGRIQALAELRRKGEDLPLFPVVYIEAEDEEEAKQKLLRLNSQYGQMSIDSVLEFAGDINIEFEELQLPEGILQFSLDSETQEGQDGEIAEDVEPVAKRGDIWQLGNHRLMCGDSTLVEDVEKLMNGEKADLVFTDPPYGMKKESEGVLNDNLNYDALLEFNKKWIKLAFESLAENTSFYCWGTDEPLMDIYSEIIKPMIKEGLATFRNIITWNKGSGQGQKTEEYRMYPIADEKCIFVMTGVQGFNTNADNYYEGWEPIRRYLYDSRIAMGWDVPTMKKIVGHSCLSRDHWTSKSQWDMPTREAYKKMKAEADRLRAETNNDAFKKEYDEIKKDWYATRAYFDNTHDNQNNVWAFPRASGEEREARHATPKPIALCERAIKSSSRDGETVLDFFGGSGSTLIACENLNRKCYMMELDEKYCTVIINRWETRTGQKAVKIG